MIKQKAYYWNFLYWFMRKACLQISGLYFCCYSTFVLVYINGFAQDYSNSIADTLTLPQSCDKLWISSLFLTGRCGCNLKSIIFKVVSRIDNLSISCKIALRWIHVPWDITDDWSALPQVMNCLVPSGNKPLLEPMLNKYCVAYGVIRPQRVKCSSFSVSCFWPAPSFFRRTTSSYRHASGNDNPGLDTTELQPR